MDRRQKKTKDAIFRAFSALLEKKRYDHITVQEIIDEADVGRSTFYAHFATKDLLLKAMCSDIFDHIFAGDVCRYTEVASGLEAKLAHILWHLRDGKGDVLKILASDSGELFMGYFKEHMAAMFALYLGEFRADVPADFLLNHLVGSFAEAVRWWLKGDGKAAPEMVARYFTQATGMGGST